MKWFTTPHCELRIHCRACRQSRAFRESLVKARLADAPEFPCPFGADGGLGSFIEKLVKPIAKALRLPCLKADGSLKPRSKCAERRDRLNRLVP